MNRTGEIHVGTSGWHYPHWKGGFYPADLARTGWLRYYAGLFSCVEVNSSFYGLPDAATIDAWREETPENFVFAVKAPRTITHLKKLRNCEDSLGLFLGRLERFGRKLGPVLFQLPPRWHGNPARLSGFLQQLPDAYHYAFEFRDPSWHTEEIYEVLRENHSAFCVYDLKGFTSPLIDTAEVVYIRLHGPGQQAYTGSYSGPALNTWAGRGKRWCRREQKNVFLFFDNDESAFAAKNAARLIQMLASDCPVISPKA